MRQSKRKPGESSKKLKKTQKMKGRQTEKNTMQDKSQAYVFGFLLRVFFLADTKFSTPFRETVSRIDI